MHKKIKIFFYFKLKLKKLILNQEKELNKKIFTKLSKEPFMSQKNKKQADFPKKDTVKKNHEKKQNNELTKKELTKTQGGGGWGELKGQNSWV